MTHHPTHICSLPTQTNLILRNPTLPPQRHLLMTTPSIAEAVTVAVSEPISPTSCSKERIKKLWEEAITEYERSAYLSKEQKAVLQLSHNLEDVFNLAKNGWTRNITGDRRGRHDNVQRMVSKVLGVFGVIDAALGLAGTVHPDCDSHANLQSTPSLQLP